MPYDYNREKSYALVDEDGKVIEYFRVKATAITSKSKFQKLSLKKLKIIKIKDGNSLG